ncbi:MAG: hypothetical protein JSW31_17980 [Burkholderiales bacterium]|nr:MAG: hypothetical protein JSW31_17980 [Burkholderiales bacterium]
MERAAARNRGVHRRDRECGADAGPRRLATAAAAPWTLHRRVAGRDWIRKVDPTGPRLWLGVLLAALLLAACAREKVFRWEEEVVLSTGETLVLERTTRYRRSGEPYNPLRAGWAPEDSGIAVRAGAPDLIGASYAAPDWIEPVVVDRDPHTRDLVMVGTAWNCDWVRKYAGKAKGLYVAFRLRPGVEAEAIPMPDWAWGRTRNLYLTYFEIEPPKWVTPAQAERHNKTDARGAPEYFRIDPTIRFCEESSHAR